MLAKAVGVNVVVSRGATTLQSVVVARNIFSFFFSLVSFIPSNRKRWRRRKKNALFGSFSFEENWIMKLATPHMITSLIAWWSFSYSLSFFFVVIFVPHQGDCAFYIFTKLLLLRFLGFSVDYQLLFPYNFLLGYLYDNRGLHFIRFLLRDAAFSTWNL